MSRLLWIHTNHHSSCKTVSSFYDSVALRIFQLLASFINRAILGSFGNTGLLLHRPQLVSQPLHLRDHLTSLLPLRVAAVAAPSRRRSKTSPKTPHTGSRPQCSTFVLSMDYYNNKGSGCLKQISSQQRGEK